MAACQAFFTAIDAQLQRDSQMPLAYYEILVRLSEAPAHTLRMTQLAEAAAASKSRMSHAVARLEERRWVQRVDCPTDRRGQNAVLTQEGYAALAEAAHGHVEQVRRSLFDALTPEQVRQLKAICDAMISAGDPAAAAGGTCPPPCQGDEDLAAGDLAAGDLAAQGRG
jgi:DNA-binding MarR family transcriptional regulator